MLGFAGDRERPAERAGHDLIELGLHHDIAEPAMENRIGLTMPGRLSRAHNNELAGLGGDAVRRHAVIDPQSDRLKFLVAILECSAFVGARWHQTSPHAKTPMRIAGSIVRNHVRVAAQSGHEADLLRVPIELDQSKPGGGANNPCTHAGRPAKTSCPQLTAGCGR